MACLSSSSSSSSSRIWKHDVFVSFRDEDTRDFTRSLLAALEGAGITTFSVDKKLENTGDSMISILREIEESQIHMVVFSENYAASRRCLEEMAKIAGCINVPGHSVMPIFYRVNRSKIVKKRYDAEHEEKFRLSPDEVRRWRVATTALAKRPG